MKVFLCGRDNIGWATDDDYYLTRRALSGFVDFVETPALADVIHTVSWRALLTIPVELLSSRIVIAHVSHDIRAMLGQPDYLKIVTYVNRWIGPSLRAERMLSLLGLPTTHIPYVVDTSVFHPVPSAERKQLRADFGLPDSAYLIGSFQRDTEGHDLVTPKLVKGPDLFFEIVRKLHASGSGIHVVLAGPRRIWLKRRLTEANIPFTFIGEECGAADDFEKNTLSHKTINELYNVVDLYIVSSRLEGGPKAILECAAAGTKLISSSVGQAPDVLQPAQIFRSLPEAVGLIAADMRSDHLGILTQEGLASAQNHHPESVTSLWRTVYNSLSGIQTSSPAHFLTQPPAPPSNWWHRLFVRCFGSPICFDYVPRRGPWGGGNQFLTALSLALPQWGWRVRFGKDNSEGIVLLNSFHSKLIERTASPTKRYVHRIDGPTVLIRGKDVELDQEIFYLNKRLAAVSVMQSEWSLFRTLELGFRPINPVLIHNAANPKIFHPARHQRPVHNRKLKLISTSWSDNPRKGGSIYKWLDENLDWDRFEYTFVGRTSEPLQNIQVVAPVASRKLGALLRSHDVYITASDNDPCSNALIEALSSGLPAIYLNRGGHPELVSFGGLGFEQPEEIPALLDSIVADYDAFRRLAVAPNLKEVTQRYAECFDLACGRL